MSTPTSIHGSTEKRQYDLPRLRRSSYVINLDRSTDRLAKFREINGHLSYIERVSAVDGRALNREELEKTGYMLSNCPYRIGALGTAISHIKLWERAVATNCPITVFEDDAVISYHFERRVSQILSDLPRDWDFIQWGVLLNPLYAWVDLGISKARLHVYGGRGFSNDGEASKFQTAEYPSTGLKLLHSFGFQSYSISAKGARLALDYVLPLRDRLVSFPQAGVTTSDEGIDVAMCAIYPDLKAFVCLPPLVIARGGVASVRKAIDSSEAT